MKRQVIIRSAVLTLSIIIVLLSGCSASASTADLKVVTSTSLITLIVERISGDSIDVVNIIPPAQCPGHFDVKPSDIQKLADADLFLIHGWQGEKFSQDLIDSANNTELIVTKIDVTGNLTPQTQMEATTLIAAALARVDPDNSSAYQQAADEYKAVISAKDDEMKAMLSAADISGVNVICAERQAGFIKWAGMNVVATYGSPDHTLTPKMVRDLVDLGRKENVTLIVDNLQSGEDAGAGIAEELGCQRITLSNFPGCFEDTETWEKSIDRNVELILEALSR